MPCRASSPVGFGVAVTTALAAINWPDVQKPHCGPSPATNASCSGSSRSPSASPSTVVTARPSAQTASWLQE